MSVIRVNKNSNYVTMNKTHFKEKGMSLKAKGLLSEMLSLPDDWDYSIKGLVAINKENINSIRSTLDELKRFKYLVITKKLPNETDSGRIEYIYDIYEEPQKQDIEKQDIENQYLENQYLENQIQYNNIILNNNKLNNKYNIYGTYKRIKLTEKEYKKLVDDFGEEFIKKQIELLDEYVESNNNKNKYSNFNLVLRKSIREHWFQKNNEILPKWFDKEMKKEEIDDDTKRIVAEIEGTQADNNKLW